MTEPQPNLRTHIVIDCNVCGQQLTVLVMPGQPPTPISEKCVLHQMWRDGHWAFCEMSQLFDGCVEEKRDDE